MFCFFSFANFSANIMFLAARSIINKWRFAM